MKKLILLSFLFSSIFAAQEISEYDFEKQSIRAAQLFTICIQAQPIYPKIAYSYKKAATELCSKLVANQIKKENK